MPWWLTAAVVARDVMIGLGALVYRLWFGPLHGRPTRVSKINTGAQLVYVMLVLLNAAVALPAAGRSSTPRRSSLLATTVLSGWHYLRTLRARAWLVPRRPA